MSRADVQQNRVSSGIETLGDWQGSFPHDLQRIEVLVRLPDMSATPTASCRPRGEAVSAARTCGPPKRDERAACVPDGSAGWIPDWNYSQWVEKLRPWGQTAQVAAAGAVLLLIVIALLLIRGPGGEEARPAASSSPQEEDTPQLALPTSPQERAVGFQDLPIIPLLPSTRNPRELSPEAGTQAGEGSDDQGESAASDRSAAALSAPADSPATRQTPERATDPTERAAEESTADDSLNQQEPASSADVAKPEHASAADLATDASPSPESKSAGEAAKERAAASSSGEQNEAASGERLAERADESSQPETGESAPAIAPPAGPSLETQFTQHSGAADGSSRRATSSSVDHRSYPETNPSSYRYPSTYHRLFFPAARDSADAQGVPSRETRSIYEPPSNTARLQPQLEPPPIR